MTLLARKTNLSESGAAAVELALLILIFGPLAMFTVFSADLVKHLLDVQEAAISTTWDLSTRPWGKQDVGGSPTERGDWHVYQVFQRNRVQFADHDSSFTNEPKLAADGGKILFSSADHAKHHTDPFGHLCWCNGGNCEEGDSPSPYTDQDEAAQVTCQLIRGTGVESYDPGSNHLRDSINEGGVAECWAKGWFYNYLLGNSFIKNLPAAEKVPLFQHRRASGDVHNQSGTTDATGDYLLRARAGLLVDTWALMENGSVGLDDTSGTYYDRVKTVFTYMPWYTLATGAVGIYAGKVGQKKLALVGVTTDAGHTMIMLDSITGLWMNAQFEDPSSSADLEAYKSDDYFTTPFYGDLKTSFESKRGKYYLGAKDAEQQ